MTTARRESRARAAARPSATPGKGCRARPLNSRRRCRKQQPIGRWSDASVARPSRAVGRVRPAPPGEPLTDRSGARRDAERDRQIRTSAHRITAAPIGDGVEHRAVRVEVQQITDKGNLPFPAGRAQRRERGQKPKNLCGLSALSRVRQPTRRICADDRCRSGSGRVAAPAKTACRRRRCRRRRRYRADVVPTFTPPIDLELGSLDRAALGVDLSRAAASLSSVVGMNDCRRSRGSRSSAARGRACRSSHSNPSISVSPG